MTFLILSLPPAVPSQASQDSWKNWFLPVNNTHWRKPWWAKGCRRSVNSPSSPRLLYFGEEPGFGTASRQRPFKKYLSQMTGAVASARGNCLPVSNVRPRLQALLVSLQVPECVRSKRKCKTPCWQISLYLAPIQLFLHAGNKVKISLK